MKFASALSVLFITAFMTIFGHAQGMNERDTTTSYKFIFLPSGLTFPPLRANNQEARIGVFKFLDQSDMKVDIGNTIDVFGLERRDNIIKMTAGIDFMGFALTTGANGLRLQIDALDGIFGGNVAVSYSIREDEKETGLWKARLRLLHHSAHLVDGHFDNVHNQWLDNRLPFAYSRDFGELILSRESAPRQEKPAYRIYAGFSYATLVRPSTYNRLEYLAGSELYSPLFMPHILGKPANFFFSYNINLTGAPSFQATHQVQGGIKFGERYGKGPAIYLGYYSGRQMFAEYYDLMVTTIGAGFTVDF